MKVLLAMTDAMVTSLTTSIGTVLMSAISAYFAYKAKAISIETHRSVNSRLSELLELTKKAALAEGKLIGEADEKNRQTKEKQ